MCVVQTRLNNTPLPRVSHGFAMPRLPKQLVMISNDAVETGFIRGTNSALTAAATIFALAESSFTSAHWWLPWAQFGLLAASIVLDWGILFLVDVRERHQARLKYVRANADGKQGVWRQCELFYPILCFVISFGFTIAGGLFISRVGYEQWSLILRSVAPIMSQLLSVTAGMAMRQEIDAIERELVLIAARESESSFPLLRILTELQVPEELAENPADTQQEAAAKKEAREAVAQANAALRRVREGIRSDPFSQAIVACMEAQSRIDAAAAEAKLAAAQAKDMRRIAKGKAPLLTTNHVTPSCVATRGVMDAPDASSVVEFGIGSSSP